jgi:hypothetical protein
MSRIFQYVPFAMPLFRQPRPITRRFAQNTPENVTPSLTPDQIDALNKRDDLAAMEDMRQEILTHLPVANEFKEHLKTITNKTTLQNLSYMVIMRKRPLTNWQKVSVRKELMDMYQAFHGSNDEEHKTFIVALLHYYQLLE